MRFINYLLLGSTGGQSSASAKEDHEMLDPNVAGNMGPIGGGGGGGGNGGIRASSSNMSNLNGSGGVSSSGNGHAASGGGSLGSYPL